MIDAITHWSINSRAKVLSGGVALGFRTPMAIVVQKGDEQRLLIATRNTAGGINAAIDSDSNTAFDLFRLY